MNKEVNYPDIELHFKSEGIYTNHHPNCDFDKNPYDDFELSAISTKISGSAKYMEDIEEDPEEILGIIEGISIRAEDYSYDLFDAEAPAGMETDGILQALAALYPDGAIPDIVLIVEKLAIEKKYRGWGLGSLLLKKFMKHFGDSYSGATLLIADPIHYENGTITRIENSDEDSKKRLISFYKRLGFKQIEGLESEPLMYLNNDED